MFREPWNNWYHCMGHTYGSWLPGSPRGWRTKHHRLHVEGDYREPPPPDRDAKLHRYSKRAMKHEPFQFKASLRATACAMIVESLQRHDLEVIIAALNRVHFHALVRIDDRRPKHWIGLAKKDASRGLSDAGLARTGPIWAAGSKAVPVENRDHQVFLVGYIAAHRKQGAHVWAMDSIAKRIGISTM